MFIYLDKEDFKKGNDSTSILQEQPKSGLLVLTQL